MWRRVIYPLLIIILGCLFFWQVLLHPNQILFGIDTIDYYAFYKYFASEGLRLAGELPFWNPLSFSGTPFLGNGQEGLFYPPALLFYLFPTDSVFGFFYLLHCILGGIGLYLLMGVLGLSPFPSFVSALTFMFTLRFMSGAYSGHLPLVIQATWAPFAFLFLELTIRQASYGFALLTGLVLSLAYLAGHVQVLFYLSSHLFLYLLFHVYLLLRAGLRRKVLKVFFLFLLIFVTCAGLSSIQLLPFLGEAPYLLRSEAVDYDAPGQNHLSPRELTRLLFPHYFGSPLTVTDGGMVNQLLETTAYVGILPLVLSVIAIMIYRKEKTVLFWAVLALFTLPFAMGPHSSFYPLIHTYIPGFKYFMTPARMLWFFALFIAILAGYGTAGLFGDLDNRSRIILKGVLLALGVIGFLALTMPLLFKEQVPGLTLFVFLLAASSFLIVQNLKPDWFGQEGRPLLVAILLLDLWTYGMPLIKTVDPGKVFSKSASVSFLERMEGEFRVLDLLGDARQKVAGRSHIQSLNGYDSSILKHYAEFYNLIWDRPNPGAGITALPLMPLEEIKNRHLLNLLNTQYIITGAPTILPGFQLVYQAAYQSVRSRRIIPIFIYENKEVLPRAFVVRNARVVRGKEAIFDELRRFDPKTTVILEEDFERLTYPGNYQPAVITSYKPNRVSLRVDLESPGFLVLCDVWFPGWKAFDNGKESRVFKADYTLRSIFLESGMHQIEFVYDPLSYHIGRLITLGTLLLLLVYGGLVWKKKRPVTGIQDQKNRTAESQEDQTRE